MVNQNLHQQFQELVQKYKFPLDKTQLRLNDSFNLNQQYFSDFVEFLYNETQCGNFNVLLQLKTVLLTPCRY